MAVEVRPGIAGGPLYLLPNGLPYWSASPYKLLLRVAAHWSGIHVISAIRIPAFHNGVLRFCRSYKSWEMNRTSAQRQGRTDVRRLPAGKQSDGRRLSHLLRTSERVHVRQFCVHVRWLLL